MENKNMEGLNETMVKTVGNGKAKLGVIGLLTGLAAGVGFGVYKYVKTKGKVKSESENVEHDETAAE